ncbi:transcriptional regulator [Dinoroseobacter shibae DFL 12 = DSM 16493]|jgi:RNA polymerase-binding transcription factor DksA|uniref:Transcriptional regulator n=1 Tax=Dinoroseobacter shibae (strain DSM 16493 / NCIMB 14021 / DFL 12) TaxID=398580 RepID=A8LRA7_DINSH|nr:TraR/DksA family transcriptional regulator [Dinoroseobacter shibae]ABV92557.1 transcriptional regulator [Dinoroseobacter shibae DFL 12 = DSM 16493]URF47500.1 TraR/DksA family transcriptional regulator [Dinoroseobacter shibae]URF51811.1 TraR/DksA family transcriptional regulator [Dinoroseobacter shibae]
MDITAFEKTLRARRAEIVGDLARIEDALDDTPPKDWEDRASERQGDEVLEALGHAEQAELTRIDAALDRIAKGIYGTCLKCGDPIAEARLKAVPTAPLCATCAAG